MHRCLASLYYFIGIGDQLRKILKISHQDSEQLSMDFPLI